MMGLKLVEAFSVYMCVSVRFAAFWAPGLRLFFSPPCRARLSVKMDAFLSAVLLIKNYLSWVLAVALHTEEFLFFHMFSCFSIHVVRSLSYRCMTFRDETRTQHRSLKTPTDYYIYRITVSCFETTLTFNIDSSGTPIIYYLLTPGIGGKRY